MKNIYYLINLSILLCLYISAKSQHYEIDVNIKNLGDSTIYLGYYFGDKQFARDTLVLNKKGMGTFSGKDTLPEGMYFVLIPGNTFFEVVMGEDQKFSLETEYTNTPNELVKKLKSEGSKDMDLYIDYQVFMTKQSELAIDLRDRLKKSENETEKNTLKDSLSLLHKEVKDKWEKIEKEHPKSIIAAILKFNKEIDVPEPPKDENGVIIDSAFQFNYYKAHYFDNFNFNDERLLRTQFFHPKLDRYFEKLIVPAPDTVIKESKMVLDKAEQNEEVFKYTLQFLFNKYNNSNIMGMDKAFVFFAENYYLNGKAHWADSAWLEKVRKRVYEIKPNLVGKKAPEIKLFDANDQIISLYGIDAEYTILFFYEPSCGHCKKATPKMKKISEKYWEKGVEVLGIYTQVEKNEWIEFIKSQELDNWINAWDPYHQSNFRNNYDVRSTPSIYLLDKDKNIIGKRIDPETVDTILENKFKDEN